MRFINTVSSVVTVAVAAAAAADFVVFVIVVDVDAAAAAAAAAAAFVVFIIVVDVDAAVVFPFERMHDGLGDIPRCKHDYDVYFLETSYVAVRLVIGQK